MFCRQVCILNSIFDNHILSRINVLTAALTVHGARIGQFRIIECCRLVNIVNVLMLGNNVTAVGNGFKGYDRFTEQLRRVECEIDIHRPVHGLGNEYCSP